jgi:glutamine synthetase
VICDIVWQDGTLVANAPRTALKNAVQRLAGHGLKATCAVEYEFLLFAESPRSIREKRFRNLTPAFEGVHSYSHLRADELREFLAEAVEAMNTLGIPVEALHTEYAPGNVEITFNYADPLNAADTAARFKLAVKMAAKRNNMVATFMARSMEGERASGMSGHLHIGLRDEKGRNAMWGGQANRLSQTGIHFLAGILATLNEFCAFYGPTVNSYRRTVPHSFAPTNVTWGYENRSAAVRVLARDEPSTRLEHRRPGADANPYAVIAAALAGGCYGVDRAEEPPQALEGNAYDSTSAPECPTNLLEAIELLERGEVARDYLGKDFVDHFIGTRRWEWNQYSAAVLGRLSEWELERYFEMI